MHRRDDLFHGPELGKIPDLIFEFADYAWVGKGNLIKRTPTIWDTVKKAESGSETYVGTHRLEGIVGFTGPSAARSDIATANIADIAPTILHLLGEAVPLDMEGRVLEEIITPELLDARPPEFADADAIAVGAVQDYASEDLDEIEGRLRSLGYIE